MNKGKQRIVEDDLSQVHPGGTALETETRVAFKLPKKRSHTDARPDLTTSGDLTNFKEAKTDIFDDVDMTSLYWYGDDKVQKSLPVTRSAFYHMICLE
jgi:hypothetical protein